MFCSNCGTEANGNFCWKCGAALQGGSDSSPEPVTDWQQEVRYEHLIRIPEVRDRIGRHAAMAQKSMSGEEFLDLFDKVVPLGISLGKIGVAVQPIYAQLGIKTGKERSESFASPSGAVIVSALCSLGRNGQALQRVRQFEDGCLLEAALPSDLRSWKGDLYVTVRRAGEGTYVEAATSIKGQLFDWGKSKRCLETLFADLRAIPA